MNARMAKFLAGGLTAAALTAAAGGAAWAQVSTPQQSPTPGKPAAQAQRADAFLSALASKLGKTTDEVRTAAIAAEKDLIDQAVQAGRLTQDQATKLKQRVDQNGGRGLFGGGPRLEKPGNARGGAPFARQDSGALAQFLGVTPQQLGQELRSGKSMVQVAQVHGKSRDDLKGFITSQARTRFDTAVKNGRLTQAQADQALKKLTDGLDAMIDRVPKAGPKQQGQGQPGGPRRGGAGRTSL
jgi:polyhydroxyalkanoate synthesis regulator phasin